MAKGIRFAIGFSVLATVYSFIVGVTWLSQWPSPSLVAARAADRYLSTISQLFTAIVFGFYIFRFRSVSNSNPQLSSQTHSALTKLSQIATVGFVSFFVRAVISFYSSDIDYANSVGAVATFTIGLNLVATLRSLAIFRVLDVHLPNDSASSFTSPLESFVAFVKTKIFGANVQRNDAYIDMQKHGKYGYVFMDSNTSLAANNVTQPDIPLLPTNAAKYPDAHEN